MSSKNSENKQGPISAKASLKSVDTSPVNIESCKSGIGEQPSSSTSGLRNRFGFKNVVKSVIKMNKEKSVSPTTSYSDRNEEKGGKKK